jgi:hypothetical protein
MSATRKATLALAWLGACGGAQSTGSADDGGASLDGAVDAASPDAPGSEASSASDAGAPDAPLDSSASSSASCSSASECRTFSDYCGGCACDALGKNDPDPTCDADTVSCFVDPCRDRSATCDPSHHCALQ